MIMLREFWWRIWWCVICNRHDWRKMTTFVHSAVGTPPFPPLEVIFLSCQRCPAQWWHLARAVDD